MREPTFNTVRSLKIAGWCLPVALIVGYLLADPLQSASIAVLILVCSVLVTPVLMRWHHFLLIVLWNAAVAPTFLPGRPHLWVVLAAISFGFFAINRAVDSRHKSLSPPLLTRPLLFLAVVVILTAAVTGGIGIAILGSSSVGGKNYFYVLFAIIGYFALAGRRIPVNKANFFAGAYFLSGATVVLSNLIFLAGPAYYFLYDVIPAEYVLAQAYASLSVVGPERVRVSGASFACLAAIFFLLVHFGIRGLLDLRKPWRFMFFMSMMVGGLFGGFRSFVVLILMVLTLQFFLEGLHRTKYLGVATAMCVILAVTLISVSPKLPFSVQRALSVLPVPVSSLARLDSQGTTDWRLDMWKRMLPEIPRYLWRGKGYTIDPAALGMAQDRYNRGQGSSEEVAMLAGDYHSGPLSVIIPFGIYGAVGFLWFLAAGALALYRNYRWGDPALKKINTFLLAYFLARTAFFLLVFGAFNSELCLFTGVLGLGVSLNGGVAHAPARLYSARNVLKTRSNNCASVKVPSPAGERAAFS